MNFILFRFLNLLFLKEKMVIDLIKKFIIKNNFVAF